MKTIAILICLALCLTWCAYGISVTDVPDAATKDASVKDVVSEADVVVDANVLPDAFIPLRDASVSYGGFDYGSPEELPIEYHGGRVLTSPVNVYLIWYGDWQDARAVPIIEDLIASIGSSDWFQINTGYYQLPPSDAGIDIDASAPKTYVTNNISLSKEVFIGYTHGNSLSETDVSGIVSDQINNSQLPSDENGIYFVLTDKYVSQNNSYYSSCTDYCGWHEHTQINGADIKYGWIGDTERCPQNCSAESDYLSTGFSEPPNGDWSADGMSTIIAHELSESVTDPNVDAWQDFIYYENADKCAWTFGLVYVTSNNSVANVKIGSREWLIQQNWVLTDAGGHCDLHL
jgi:hypothetical protein